jgi:hypothetical protein
VDRKAQSIQWLQASRLRLATGLAVLLFVAASLCGCFSRLTGSAGEFTFGYRTDVQIENFNKPLAPGSQLNLVAFEDAVGPGQLQIVSARSSDPSVLAVVDTTAQHATIEAMEPGHARITMVAKTRDGTTVEDSVDMNAAEPVALDLRHGCADTPRAAYVADDTITIPFEMTDAHGRAVIGEGYQPVFVEPAGALEFVTKPMGRSVLVFETGSPIGEAWVRSRVDDAALALRLVQRSDIDKLEAGPLTKVTRTVRGGKVTVRVVPFAGDDPVCQSGALTKARSLTPHICFVTADLDESGSNQNRLQSAVVVGRGFGICEYEMSLPEANGGDGLRATFELPVGEFPSRDRRGAAEEPPSDDQPESSPPWYLAPLLALLAPALLAPIALWWRRRNGPR